MSSLSLSLALVLLAADPVEPRPQPGAGDLERAHLLFTWGQRLYQQARYPEAIAKFEEAYALRPHPIVFYNLGRCWERLGQVARALRAYQEYLRLLPDAEDRGLVSEAMLDLERRLREQGVQQLMVFTAPGGARVEVDGKDLGTSPTSVELQPGTHQVTVTADGFQAAERAVELSPAHSTAMTITLLPRAGGSDAPRRTELSPPPGAPSLLTPPPSTAPRRRVLTWVAGGAAAAGLGTGVALGLVASGKAADYRAGGHPPSQTQALYDDARSLATGANVAYGVAGGAALTAVVLFLLER